MGSFSLDLKAYVEKTKEKADTAVRIALLDVGDKLINRTPVGNRELWAENIKRAEKNLPLLPKGYVGGKLRNSWDMAIGEKPSALYRVPDATGADSKARIEAAIPEKAAGHIYQIANNQAYAQVIEDGHSTQLPPGGMVGLTVLDWQGIVKDAVARVQT